MSDEIKDLNLQIKSRDDEITRLKAELDEIKYKFNEAEQIANFGFWEVNPATLDPTWTEGVFKIIGLDPQKGQLKYFDQKKIVHPDDWDYFYQALLTVLKTGKDNEIDVKFIKTDGSVRIFHIIGKPKKDEDGKIIGLRGTAQDITELKNIETRLKESESFYRTLFENTGTATIVVDEDTTILMANSQFEELSGYTKEEVEGKLSWKELVSVDFLELIRKYHNMRRKGSKTPPKVYEAKMVNREGLSKYILINVSIIPGTKRSIASIADLTERKKFERKLEESEKRYRYIVEKATAGMFILDEKGIIRYLNEHMAQMLHYSKEEMLKQPIKNFVGDNEEFYRYRQPFEVEIERYNWFKILDKNGKVYWSNLNISPIFNKDKEYIGCMGIVTDINMQKGLEEAYLEREEIFTNIIYDMMEILNKIANDKAKEDPYDQNSEPDHNN